MMDDNNASNSLQVHKVPSMHAHQRMLGTRAPSGAVRGSSKPGDTGPEGDMSWEAGGSAHTAISEEDQMCERTQQAREEAAALDHSNHGDDSQGMLADAFSRLNGGGAGGGVGLDSEDRGSSRTDQARQQQLSYHAGDVRSQAMGYAGRLSSIQEAALDALRQWLTSESVDLTPLLGDGTSCPPEDKDLALLRFLRHNKWDVEQTKTQMMASLSWRVETGVTAALRREPWEASRCSSQETFEKLCEAYYPHYTIGVDRLGRPVLVQKYGTFNTHKLKQYTTLDGLLAYHAWEQEKNAELLRRSTIRTGHLMETYTVIMDFKGMGIGLVGGDFRWLLRELSDMDRKHYPGRGGEIYVINTPPLFGLVWHGISHFMEATQARIHIFSKEHEWKAALAEGIDATQLPIEYGGTAPALADTPFLHAVHRALEKDTKMGATVGAIATAATEKAETVSEGTATAETVTTAPAIGLLDEDTAAEAANGGATELLDEQTASEAINDGTASTGLFDAEPATEAHNDGPFDEGVAAEATNGGDVTAKADLLDKETAAEAANGSATGLLNEQTATEATNGGEVAAKAGLLDEETIDEATNGVEVAANTGILNEETAAEATNGGGTGLLDEETAARATNGDDVAAKTMEAILLHFSLDGHDWRHFNRNFTATNGNTGDDGCGSIEGDDCDSVKGDTYGSGGSVVGDHLVVGGGVDSKGLEDGRLAGEESALDPTDGVSGGGVSGDVNRVCETVPTDSVLEVTTAATKEEDSSAEVNALQEVAGTRGDDSAGENALQEAKSTSNSQTRDGPPASESRDPTVTSGRSTPTNSAGARDTKNESTAAGTRDTEIEDPAAGTKDANNAVGAFSWFLNIVPGARLAATVVGTVSGNTFGASLHAAGFAAGVVQAVVPDCVWEEGMRAFAQSKSIGRQSCGR